ncbi:MAG: FAD-dependent oxidoreductase [bacterium]|nr:FAD-dependent oxidoreductase [bacterium]
MYQVAVIGGGPAGVAAAVYAARKKLKTLLLTEDFGGQSIVSDDIQNWIGEPHISGFDLAQKLENHIRSYSDVVDIQVGVRATAMKKSENGDFFLVECNNGKTYETETVILAIGARRRKLGVPGEEKFNGKGVVYCSTCDAPIFSGKRTVVIGGGNAGLEAVQDLASYASETHLLESGTTLKGDPVTQEAIHNISNFKGVILNAEVLEIVGSDFVTGLRYRDKISGEEKNLDVDGVFVEIGSVPNSEIAKDLVDLNSRGEVIVDSKLGTTSRPGIFAAGDITDDPYKQNNISTGDGVKAALAAYQYILKKK